MTISPKISVKKVDCFDIEVLDVKELIVTTTVIFGIELIAYFQDGCQND